MKSSATTRSARQVKAVWLARPTNSGARIVKMPPITFDDAVLAFKRFLNEQLLRSGALLEPALFGSVTGTGAQAFVELHALAIGSEHLARQSEVTRQVEQKHPHLALGSAAFASRFTHAATALLRRLQFEQYAINNISTLPLPVGVPMPG